MDAILARYRKTYPTDEARGTLTFSEIEVRPLGEGYALALGKYSLKRTAAGGGDASGRFTLVLWGVASLQTLAILAALAVGWRSRA